MWVILLRMSGMTSIQRRLNFSLAVLGCVVWLGGAVSIYFAVRANLLAEFDLALIAEADGLASLTEEGPAGYQFEDNGQHMSQFVTPSGHASYFQIRAPDGTTIIRSRSLTADLPLRQAGTLDAPHFWNVTLPDGLRARAIGARYTPRPDGDAPAIATNEKQLGPVTLVAAFPRGELDKRLHFLAIVLGAVGLAIFAAMWPVVAITVRWGLLPLSALGHRAVSIGADSLALRFPTDKLPRELLPIAQRLNDLLARLEASFIRERRFSADVAHELRTPIAELRSLVEVTTRWPEDSDSVQSALRDAFEIALQMESITTRLLALTRCEENSMTLTREPVALAALLRRILKPLAAQIQEKRLVVQLKVAEDNCWQTDKQILQSILINLVRNAIEYSAPGTSVTIREDGKSQAARLIISNVTRDLAPADIPHLFERLWRKDAARSSDGHFGLGLSLAKAYGRLLGMELRAELGQDGTLTMILSGATRCDVASEAAIQSAELSELSV